MIEALLIGIVVTLLLILLFQGLGLSVIIDTVREILLVLKQEDE